MKKFFGLTLALVAVSGCASLSRIGSEAGVLDVTSASSFRMDMRKLWSDHVVWTRNYIIAAVDGSDAAPTALARLMRNQEDIGAAVKPYYGDAASTKLTALLKDHIAIAGELVAAAKAGDNVKKADADKRWHDNAAEIATFLAGANPNWKQPDLLMMLHQHLSLTTQEAVARLQKKWSDDQATFDGIYGQAMQMADALSDGIIKQFPLRFN